MKQQMIIKQIIISTILLLSCSCSNDISSMPTEKCENIPIDCLPIITHGFHTDVYDSVIVETFVKNSNFDTLLNSYVLKLSNIRDIQRIDRQISLPKEITTGMDFKIAFNPNLVYKITEIQTSWVPRWCHDFCGYQCTMTSFKINDSLYGTGNIFIQEPNFKYPWEK